MGSTALRAAMGEWCPSRSRVQRRYRAPELRGYGLAVERIVLGHLMAGGPSPSLRGLARDLGVNVEWLSHNLDRVAEYAPGLRWRERVRRRRMIFGFDIAGRTRWLA